MVEDRYFDGFSTNNQNQQYLIILYAYLCSVKFLYLIFSFYLLILAIKPCCADDNCQEKETEKTATNSSHPEDCKECSPFFTCGSCSGFTISASFVQLAPSVNDYFLHRFTSYKEPSLQEISHSVWQPPKLG